MEVIPSYLHLNPSTHITFTVPKFHLPAHIKTCWESFNYNFAKWTGHSDGEGKPEEQRDVETPILKLFDACVAHGVHPEVFKKSVTVVIPKPNKPDYSSPKAYRVIALPNCLGKVLEKIVARRLSYYAESGPFRNSSVFDSNKRAL